MKLRKRPSLFFLALFPVARAQSVSPGTVSTNVPWKAGHASVFQDPYVIVYGGTTDTSGNTTSAMGTNSVWAWHSQNRTWYDAQALSNYATNDLQVFFQAVSLPAAGQTLMLASNTTNNGALLQKLDTNVWSWANPTSLNPPATASGYTMTIVDNRIYTFGGVGVDGNGNRMNGAVLNSLYFLDANSYAWSSGSNGPAITDHSTCFISSCNCLVTFGGTQTGNPADASRNVYVYDLNSSTWNLQVNPGSVNGAIPGPRRLHTATCLQNKMIVYGGGTTTASDSGVWILDASAYPNFTWYYQNMANQDQGPRVRMGHSAVHDPNHQKIYIYGGWGSSYTDNNIYVLDYNAWSWSNVKSNGVASNQQGNGSDGNNGNNGNGNNGAGANVGAIAGGVVGGVAALAIVGALAFFCYRRRRNQQKEQQTGKSLHTEKKMMDQDDDDDQDDYYWRYGSPVHHDTHYDDPQNHYHDDNHGFGFHDSANQISHSHKRVSKAWTAKTGNTNTDSFYRRSDGHQSAGDMAAGTSTGHVVLDLMSPSDDAATASPHSLRGSRHSLASKQYLAGGSNDLSGPGQVPNEVITQKPNEFSVPASQFAAHMNNSIRIHHYNSDREDDVTSSHRHEDAPVSSSMEVLQSIKTNTTATTTRNVPITHAYHHDLAARKRDDASLSRAFSTATGDEDDSIAVLPEAPIQYIPGASKQFSVATTATNNSAPSQLGGASTDTTRVVPLTHHQYPSSSVPVARPVSSSAATHYHHHPIPPNDATTHGDGAPTASSSAPDASNSSPDQVDDGANDTLHHRVPNTAELYDSVSPLDRLATLSANPTLLAAAAAASAESIHNNQQQQQSASNNGTLDDEKNITPPHTSNGTPNGANYAAPVSTPSTTTTSTTTEHSHEPPKETSLANDKHASLAAIGNMLPRRYRVDRAIAPVIGPTNSILYISVHSPQSAESSSNAVVKSFGRREAWERECRSLVKLKSPFVVDLLEVLTIQDESSTSTTARGTPQSSASLSDHQKHKTDDENHDDDNEDDDVKYLTVMERLDETLSTVIRRARNATDASAYDRQSKFIAMDIVRCLKWCHEKGVAFCDLKPSNLMHRTQGPWKLIDFEASRTIGEECVGVITPRYCPPEVARATTYGLEGANGVVATASVDLWALGCVLYELETKRPLFAATIKDETILHFVSHPSSSTPILNNGLRWNDQKELEIPQLDRQIKNKHARALIKQLLSRDPAKRGNATQLLDHPYFA
ncbi:hypothetical protein BC940DRAFT_290850 [Gongronella butleri]|nr:hypothetical protein BC940DRAFT_290850 [Gongronella butleri]